MSRITDIAEKALAGESVNLEELTTLYQLVFDDPQSQDSLLLQGAARELAEKACRGRGSLYAQIGIDAGPCPDNCRFCTFAACNYAKAEPRDALDEETIVQISTVFAEEGVEWVSLMTTSAYPFEKYLRIVEAVRAAIPTSTRIMSNIGDISLQQTCELKAAGVAMAYHAPRLGEGEITRVPLETRWKTMDNIRESGMLLSTGVEPVRLSTTPHELAERTLAVLAYDPYCAGTVTITVVPNTAMENEPQPSRTFRQLLAAPFRLAAGGTRVPFGNSNSAWADAGARPRGQEYVVNHAVLAQRVEDARQALRDNGWTVG